MHDAGQQQRMLLQASSGMLYEVNQICLMHSCRAYQVFGTGFMKLLAIDLSHLLMCHQSE